MEIHPGIAARGGYDTNVFRGDGDGGQPIRGAGILAITPHIALSTLSQQRKSEGEVGAEAAGAPPPALNFRLGASATYFQYFGVNPAVKNVALDFDGLLSILPERPVSVDVAASVTRQVSPFTQAIRGGANNTYAYDQISPNVKVNFQSRGGVLRSYVGFTPGFTPYEGREFKYLSRAQYDIEAGTAWKFLPTTALIHDMNLAFLDYYKFDSAPAGTQSVLLSNATRFQTRLGINGALTNRVSLRVLAGYAVSFVDNNLLDEYQVPVGEVTVGYKFDPHTLEGGYQRTVTPSAIGAYMLVDRGLAKASFMFAQRVRLGLEAGVGYVQYGRVLGPDGMGGATGLGVNGSTSRTDVRVDAGAHAEYRITNWFALLADLSVLATMTDFKYAAVTASSTPGGAPTVFPDPAKFTTFQVFGGVRFFY